jgi:hypothetical protein
MHSHHLCLVANGKNDPMKVLREFRARDQRNVAFRTAAAKVRCQKTPPLRPKLKTLRVATDPVPPQEMISEAEMKRATRNVFNANPDIPHK